MLLKKALVSLIAGIVSLSLLQPTARAADSPCQEAQEILGLSLAPQTKRETGIPPALVVTEVLPLSQAARLGIAKGDTIEQINSWRARDCQSYGRAVQDARNEQKAILLLLTHKGRRQTLAFEPEIWVRKEQEKQEKEAVASLQTMLAAPLPNELKGKVGTAGDQALAILREVETVTTVTGKPTAYEEGVAKASTQLRALDQASQGEAEKRIIAGAKVLFDYYLAAQAIRQYKQDFVKEERKDLRKGRGATFQAESIPYFLKSPVPGWIDRYPFLRDSVSETPRTENFLERPGKWDPDKAVALLWQKAKEDTGTFSQWLRQE
jgi:hypothetical protein